MNEPRKRYCFNCGKLLGELTSAQYDPLDTCGNAECDREARRAYAEDIEHRY